MKKTFFMGVMGMFLLGSCSSQSGKTDDHAGHNHAVHNHDAHDGHNHDGHNHAAEGHNHEAEVHNHDAHAGHNHEAEGHNHAAEDHDAHAGHNHAAEAPKAKADAHNHGDNPDEIILEPHKAQAAGVASEVIQPKTFHQVITCSGEIQAAQGSEMVVVANVSGVVSFQRSVTEGMQVSKGNDIMSISAAELHEGDPAQRARITFEAAKADYERASRLVESQIVSQKEFNAIKEKYENARLAYEALAKHQTHSGVAVTAPMAGYIKNLLVKEGDYVAVGQPLATVTQNNRLFLRADVSERYYSYLKGISSANFKTPYDNKVYELGELNGKVLSYGKSAGNGSFYVPVTFSFDNKGDIIPGSFVEVYLLSKAMENVISIPVEALTEEQGLYFIYIQKCKESYKKQEVKLGANNGKEVQILSGVNPGDRVVVKGAYHVKLASASNALPAHSHEH